MIRRLGRPLGLALALGVAQLGPALLRPGSTLLGNPLHPDNLGNQWLLVWVAEQLAAGRGILHTGAYYWPIGDAPVLAGNGMEGLLYLLPHLLLGYPGAVVLYALLVLVGNGLGGYLLARVAGASADAALVALAALGCSPYARHALDAGRYSQADLGPLLLFLAAFLHLLDGPTHRRALLAAGLLSLTAHLYWYYAWFGVLLGGLLLLGARPQPWRPLLSFSAAFLALTAPWAALFAQAWAAIPGTAEPTFPPAEAWADPIGWHLPLWVAQDAHPAAVIALPVALLALVGLGPLARQRPALLVGGLLFLWLALGPDGGLYPALYGLCAPLRRFWWPARHAVVFTAVIAVAAAFAADRLRRPGLVALLVAALTLPSLALQGLPVQVASRALRWPPPAYVRLGALPAGVLLQLPFAPAASASEEPLWLQLVHHKRLLGGHAPWVDRVRPAAWDAFVAENTLLDGLRRLETGESGPRFTFAAADLAALRADGLRWVALDRAHYAKEITALAHTEDRLMDAIFGPALFEQDGLSVWDVTHATGLTDLPLQPGFSWPDGLAPGGPTAPLMGGRPPNPTLDPAPR